VKDKCPRRLLCIETVQAVNDSAKHGPLMLSQEAIQDKQELAGTFFLESDR
jgi:hypothetical protein